MLSLNSLLVCNAILNLPLYKFVFSISKGSEYCNVRPFFMFYCYYILRFPHPSPFYGSSFTYLFQLILHASSVRVQIQIRRMLLALRSTFFCPTTTLPLTFLLRRKLRDLVPGTPEPHICSKSTSTKFIEKVICE